MSQQSDTMAGMNDMTDAELLEGRNAVLRGMIDAAEKSYLKSWAADPGERVVGLLMVHNADSSLNRVEELTATASTVGSVNAFLNACIEAAAEVGAVMFSMMIECDTCIQAAGLVPSLSVRCVGAVHILVLATGGYHVTAYDFTGGVARRVGESPWRDAHEGLDTTVDPDEDWVSERVGSAIAAAPEN